MMSLLWREMQEGRKYFFLHRNQLQKLKIPVFCIVYECSNRSNRENTRSFYHVRKCVVQKEGKVKKLTEKRKPASVVGRSRSDNARMCKRLI